MVFLLAMLGSADAHPNALRIVAHRAELHVESDRARVRYAVELPGHGHVGSGAPADDAQSLAVTRSGLQLRADGEPASLSYSLAEGPTPTPSGSAVIQLIGEAAAPGAHSWSLADGNYPDLPGYFAGTVTVGPGLDVVACSLFAEKDGRPVATRAGRWQIGDTHRTLSVSVTPRDGLLTRAFDALHPPPPARSAWQARAVPITEAWRSPTPALWLAYLIGGALLGLFARPRDGSRLAPVGGAVLAPVLAVAGAFAAGIAGCGLLLAGLAGRDRTRPAWPVLAALPIASIGDPLLAASSAVVFAVTSQIGAPPRGAPAVLALVALAALARVLGA